jgi:anaerobic nitric oxide reductase transcription regulator
VDELPLQNQVMLLETLQEGVFRALGSNKSESSDFKLIAALNRPLVEVLSEGKLRADFYHRIAHCTIELPPLRDRKDDIPLIISAVVRELEDREGLPPLAFELAAQDKLIAYHWPGNVRELQAVVSTACLKAQFDERVVIGPQDVELRCVVHESISREGTSLREKIDQYREKLATEALNRNGGNQVRTAEELGVDRKTLRKMIRGAN